MSSDLPNPFRWQLDPAGKAAQQQIQRWVQAVIVHQNAILERVVEQALQGGEHGVRVDYRGLDMTASVDAEVPYGQIHYHLRPDPLPPGL